MMGCSDALPAAARHREHEKQRPEGVVGERRIVLGQSVVP
jgi:hypothetical protein